MNDLPPIPTTQPKNSGLAIGSLVLGIIALVLSVICIGPLFAIPAVILGHKALSQIKRSGGAIEGHGFAVGGLVTGYIGIALIPVILLLAAIAVPNFVRARAQAQQHICIANLQNIDQAKQQWAAMNKSPDSATPTWNDLQPYLKTNSRGLLPVCPAHGTYTIADMKTAPTCSIPGHNLD
jgi:hypothetical protein